MSSMMVQVTAAEFADTFNGARRTFPLIAEMTSDLVETDGARYFLSPNRLAGYVVRADGELTNLFSLVKGLGDILVDQALEDGARRLDCFDGHLVALYSRHGRFVETSREPNWTPGGPDVVYMAAALVPAGAPFTPEEVAAYN